MNDYQQVTGCQIEQAGRELYETVSAKLWELADDLTGRPEFGTEEWLAERAERHTPAGRARELATHLVKIRIIRAAQLDNIVGIVANALRCGATSEQIGEAAGVDADTAQGRWPVSEATLRALDFDRGRQENDHD